jgi:mannose/fructose/N-acetylgalactosamine-specific phosphotransferase system component IIC
MFGSAYSCLLWMDAVGKVSGLTGLPQYADQIPRLQSDGALCFSLMLALPVIAAFLLGVEKAAPGNKLESLDDWVVPMLNYAGRLLVRALGAIAFVVVVQMVTLILK